MQIEWLQGVLFQSHAGSIEAVGPDRWRKKESMFQSHAGSIEADPAPVGHLLRGQRFNPTLVRLRPGWFDNSHLCRLPVSIPRWFD